MTPSVSRNGSASSGWSAGGSYAGSSRSFCRRSMYGCTAPPWIGPGRTSATWIVMSSRFSGRVRRIVCICARLSIWKQPTVSARWISSNTARVVERHAREVDLLAVRARDHVDALLDGGEHAEAEQVDLQEAGVGARVLVPLAHLAAGHRRRLHRHELDERPRGDDHPARDAARCGAAGRRSRCRARRTRASAASRASPARRAAAAAPRRRAPHASRRRASRAARDRRTAGRAPCRRRGSRRASGRSRSSRRATRARVRSAR